MKKKELINRIAVEFDLDEIKVSEYFDNIFETLAVTFAKNKNVNISEFGKFKVKSKLDEDGEKQKTVLFSPVKKFACDVNYNFSELTPVVIRILDDKIKKDIVIGEYLDDEVEDTILIDFEEEGIIDTHKSEEEILILEETKQEVLTEEEILIPEEVKQEIPSEEETEKPEEEILIPEEVKQEIPSEEETEKPEEEILIPEETKQEILSEEIPSEEEEKQVEEILIPEEIVIEVFEEVIPEEISEEKKQEIVPVEIQVETQIKDEIDIKEESTEIIIEQDRILSDLVKIKIPEIKFEDFEEKIELPDVVSKDKKIISEITSIIKAGEKEEDVIVDIPEVVKEEISSDITEEIIEEEIPSDISEENKEEKILSDITEEIIEEEIPSDIPEENKEEEISSDITEVVGEEEKVKKEEIEKDEESETINEEETNIITPPDLTYEEKKEEPEIRKTSLELEAELLKMLNERKKILEEIKKLEEIGEDDLIDINKAKVISSEEEQNLFEEDTLDLSKQNIFVDENGKALENLLKDFKNQENIQKEAEEISEEFEEPFKEEETVQEIKDEKSEEIIEDIAEEKTGEDIVEDFMQKEDIAEIKNPSDEGTYDLYNLFNSMYSEHEEKITLSEPDEVEPQMNNLEMKIFDKLLDKPENKFVNFKTEKIKEVESKNDALKKTETIKTYDDIFNLLEPNGKKKEEKSVKIIEDEPPKKFPPILKLIIPIVILIIIIFISVYLYRKSVFKPQEGNLQTQTSDLTQTSGSDSVIYADTNKTKEAIEEDIVYDEEGFVIKENEKGFFVQFGNYENQFELAKKIKELKEKDIFPTFDKDTTGGKLIYKLRVGPYKTLPEAKKIIPKL
ncbi:MAG: HU family DNA-binding protein [Ignavibacteria bacterium]|jgi:nucleoid DNA-binding protein